jgi:hypothetical protein
MRYYIRILALFGEHFARQFLSESLTWLDHIIFAMAPLGIITAITGAIRVSGPFWARAFIGRARETRATAEIELMSSTSREVCEVFNGRGIVRALGTPNLTQFILFPESYRTDETCGIHTLETAYKSTPPLLEKGNFGIMPRWNTECKKQKSGTVDDVKGEENAGAGHHAERQPRRRVPWRQASLRSFDLESGCGLRHAFEAETRNGKSDRSTQWSRWQTSSRSSFPEELLVSAPNIQLNLPATVPSHNKSNKELRYAATTAIVVQLTVIAVCLVTNVHRRARAVLNTSEYKVGFSLFICGTILLNMGMASCAWLIERSTREYAWRPAAHATENCREQRTSEPFGEGVIAIGNEPLVEEANQPDHVTATALDTYSKQARSSAKERQDTNMATTDLNGAINLFWLQRKHRVNDQEFGSFLILGGSKDVLITSSRTENQFSRDEPLTLPAAFMGLSGFVLQFEGLRRLTWPTAVAQLLAILVMALLRAFVRRRLGERPSTIRAPEGYELDWLAVKLVYEKGPFELLKHGTPGALTPSLLWRVSTHDGVPALEETGDTKTLSQVPNPNGSKNDTIRPPFRLLVQEGVLRPTSVYPQERNATELEVSKGSVDKEHGYVFSPSSQTLLRVRRRLGQLTRSRECTSKEALALSQAMSLILTELCDVRDGFTFEWSLDITISEANDIDISGGRRFESGADCEITDRSGAQSAPERNYRPRSRTDTIALQAHGREHGWAVDPYELDAILSLWKYSYVQMDAEATAQHPDLSLDSLDWSTKTSNHTIQYRRVLGENPPRYFNEGRQMRWDQVRKGAEREQGQGWGKEGSPPAHTDILTRDLKWWTNDARIMDIKEPHSIATTEPQLKSSPSRVELVIGFNGVVPRIEGPSNSRIIVNAIRRQIGENPPRK